MTLEQYLRDCYTANVIDHSVRCRVVGDAVTFYIHPAGKDGDTLDFLVNGNTLLPDPNVRTEP